MHMRYVALMIGGVLAASGQSVPNAAQTILETNCATCHGTAQMSGLDLRQRESILKGGKRGPAIVPGKPDDSLLYKAVLRQGDLQMPPGKKALAPEEIASLKSWIAAGAPWQNTKVSTESSWWAFKPISKPAPPAVINTSWARDPIDRFILSKLESKNLHPVPAADKRTLIRRAYFDLHGLPPSPEDVDQFVNDPTPDAYEKLIDRLLASPRYGERWGRHWLDVARFGEDNNTSEATNPPYAYAWRYRDWVIEAVNQDMPYDRFVKLQLAADLMPGSSRQDLRALGYLGTALVYHKEPRLSQEVLYTFATDDWDERVDAVSRGAFSTLLSPLARINSVSRFWRASRRSSRDWSSTSVGGGGRGESRVLT